MNPDLVRAPGFQINLHQGRRRKSLEQIVVRDAGFTVPRDREAVIMSGVAANWCIDGARKRIGVALDQGVVVLGDGPLAKRALQNGVRQLGFRYDRSEEHTSELQSR